MDIFVLIDRSIRKLYIFESLFIKERDKKGYQLLSVDNIRSLKIVNENIIKISSDFFENKSILLKFLYD